MRRLALLTLPGLLGVSLFAGSARADQVLVTAAVGTRVIVTEPVGALVPGVASPLVSVVTETLAPGINGWGVTIEACGPDSYTLPTAADCSVAGLTNADTAPDVLPESALTISDRAVVLPDLGDGVTATAVTTADTLDNSPRLFTSNNQSTSSTYNGIYTATANITMNPPSTTPGGLYKGYLVVTLVQ